MTKLLGINFHYVRPREGLSAKINGLTPEAFSSQLDALAARAAPMDPRELLKVVEGGAPPEGRDRFVLTFDDGVVEQAKVVAPELARRGWRAFMFVPTRPWEGAVLEVHKLHMLLANIPFDRLRPSLERAAQARGLARLPDVTPEQARVQYRYDSEEVAVFKFIVNFVLDPPVREAVLRDMFEEHIGDERAFAREFYVQPEDCRALVKAGFEVGLHSHAHVPLALLSPAELAADLRLNKDLLTKACGVEPWAISYPYGSPAAVTPAVIEAARACGMRLGFTMRREYVTFPTNALALARVDTNDAPGGKAPKFDLGGPSA